MLVAMWWLLLVTYPSAVSWFLPRATPRETLFDFWLADVVLLVGGSLLSCYAVATRRLWSSTAVWAVSAAAWYPTLYCLATSLRTGEAWIATAMMAGMSALSLAMASIYGYGDQTPATIRAVSLSKRSAFIWTFGQVVVFWGLFLGVLPLGINELSMRSGLAPFQHRGQATAACAVFVAASALGLWSAWVIVRHGRGTPLPTATAPQLVIAGPYRFVRNPMALAGITQGLAVGWCLGSWPVVAYAVVGAFVWHWGARPVEEADLKQRFGESYIAYQRRVPLWLPMSSIEHGCEHHGYKCARLFGQGNRL